jgi:2-octaprenyl-6-methoxyphenol hydroxylase
MTEISAFSLDVIVVGGGPAGLSAAIGLAQAGARTALVARRQPYADNRTTALLGPSIDLLSQIGVWELCEPQAAALRVMRLVDDTGRLIRAPEVVFRADEVGQDSFGFNIENRVLVEALEQRAAACAGLVRHDADAAAVATAQDHVEVTTTTGERLVARLLVGADGRHSPSREAAGIAVQRRPLDQVAVTFNVAHTRPHRNVSTEFHTPDGPCVFVPLPGLRCGVVWLNTPAEADRLLALDDAALSAAIERRSHAILGQLRVDGPRHAFPLAFEKPRAFAANRTMLVGESAHVAPPIGAQGLNMGVRDAGDVARLVGEALSRDEDVGGAALLARYDRARRADVGLRLAAIDVANRSLLSDFLPAQALRAAGLQLVGRLPLLRRLAMRQGLATGWRAP